MAILPLAILAIGRVSAAAPARAQTYNLNYPVYLRTYGISGDNMDCSYTSLPQCNASASGLAAQCLANPHFKSAREPAGYRRHRRATKANRPHIRLMPRKPIELPPEVAKRHQTILSALPVRR